jgi:hypothetical protein
MASNFVLSNFSTSAPAVLSIRLECNWLWDTVACLKTPTFGGQVYCIRLLLTIRLHLATGWGKTTISNTSSEAYCTGWYGSNLSVTIRSIAHHWKEQIASTWIFSGLGYLPRYWITHARLLILDITVPHSYTVHSQPFLLLSAELEASAFSRVFNVTPDGSLLLTLVIEYRSPNEKLHLRYFLSSLKDG